MMMEPLIQQGGQRSSINNDPEGAAALVVVVPEVQEEEINEIAAPPPISSLLQTCRFWWNFVQWPLLLSVINVIVLGCLIWSEGSDLDDIFYSTTTTDNDDYYNRHKQKQIGELSLVVLVIAVLLFLDAFLLYRGARMVQHQLDPLELLQDEGGRTRDNPYASTSSTHIYGRVSNMADQFFFARGNNNNALRNHRVGKISFLVNLAYVGMSLVLTLGFLTTVLAIYLQKRSALSDCLQDNPTTPHKHSSKDSGNMTHVPKALNKWVTTDGGARPWKEFSHLTDGTTFFAARRPPAQIIDPAEEDESTNNSNSNDGNVQVLYATTEPVLMETTSNGTLVTHEKCMNPAYFSEFDGGAHYHPDETSRKEEATFFCCVCTNAITGRHWSASFYPMNHIYCHDATTHSAHSMTGVVHPEKIFGRNSNYEGIRQARAYQGQFWFVAHWYNYGTSSRRSRQKAVVYKMDTKTFTIHQMGETELDRHPHFNRENPCLSRLYVWLDLVGYATLGLSSLILIKFLKLPSGIVPAVVAVHLAAANMEVSLAFLGSLLATICLLVGLAGRNSLPSWLHREMGVWALYSCLACGALVGVDEAGWFATSLAMFFLSAFVLNHPVLAILGPIGAFITMVMATFVFFDGDLEEVFFVVFFGVLFSAGAGSLGHSLTKYRGYLVWYSRRLVRAMEHLPSNNNNNNNNSRSGAV